MSKIMKALNKAKEVRDGQYAAALESSIEVPAAVQEKHSASAKSGYGQLVVFLILIAIGISSIFTSVKTLTELTKSRENAIALGQKIDTQREKISGLEGLLANLNTENAAQFDNLNLRIKSLLAVIKEKESEISEIGIDYNVLKVLVNELTATNQKLVDKYIGMTEEFEEVKSAKEKLEYQYQELSEKIKKMEAARATLLSQSKKISDRIVK